MKKIITLLTLLILLIDSYKINAEENLETLWVIYENDGSFIFTQNPTKTQVKANYYLKENITPSKKSYTVYKKAKSTKWCIAASDKKGDTNKIAKDFLDKNFALNKNDTLYSIYYYNQSQKKKDTDKSPHQIGSFPGQASYRKSFLELTDSGRDTTCCKFTYKIKGGTQEKISVLFTNIPQPESIKVIINFFSDEDKQNQMNDELKDRDKNAIILHRKQETKDTVNISSNKIKIIELQPNYDPEEYNPILSSLQELKIYINGTEIKSNDNNFTYKIPDNTCDNDTTSLKICLTLDDIEYKADIFLQSPPNKVWLYVICALSVLFISVLVFFVLTIWRRKKKTGADTPTVKNSYEVPTENKENGVEDKKDNPGERIIECISTLDIAYKDFITALNKITDETNNMQKEASKHSEQTKIINELEALLQNNAGEINVPFQNNNSLIEKYKLIIEQLKKINGTINKEITESNLDITGTTGNGKLITLFEELKKQKEKHQNELNEKKATINKLDKQISELSETISSLNQRITGLIKSQLIDICSIATEIRKKLPDKEQNKILLGIFEFIPNNINQMIEDITDINTLSEITINNLRHNGWIDKMLKLYTFSSDSLINRDFNERGLDTALLGEMSKKIISMLDQLGITINIPKIFTKYNKQTEDISNQEEYLTRICAHNDEILSHIRNLDKNTICDVLHVGYTNSQNGHTVKSQVNIQEL